MFRETPVEKVAVRGIPFFVKRDDLLSDDFSGNKGRKFYYFLKREFPMIKKVVSFGSLQSNAMYSLAVLSRLKNWKFMYYARINQHLLKFPVGNLKNALEYGMELNDISELNFNISKKNYFSECKIKNDTLIIPEGGRCKEAQEGIFLLAKEIENFLKKERVEKVFLPSGTGTTALYLQKFLYNIAEVITVPCVGGKEYLVSQFKSLGESAKFFPKIILPPKRYRFGKLYKELFLLWEELKKECNIEFDLIYDTVGFSALFENKLLKNILYIHQGGLKGNISMIERYKARIQK